jgi:hypothetical protein
MCWKFGSSLTSIGDKMSKSLEGKVAVIAGGGQGVGLGIAQELLTTVPLLL